MKMMDSSALSELGMESSVFFDDFMDDFFDEDELAILQQGLEACLAAPPVPEPEPTKKRKKKTKSSGNIRKNPCRASASPIILSFGNENGDQNNNSEKTKTRGELSPEEEAAVSEALRCSDAGSEDQSKGATTPPGKKTSRIRPPSQTYDHIIAERKRRELLSQRFVTLSTIVPGIKKMDKNSVLESAINYLNHLQEQVNKLEQKAVNQTRDSAVLVRRTHIIGFSENRGGGDMEEDEQALPAVEARIMENYVVVRIQCEIQKGVLVNLLRQVEDLHLVVVTSNLTALGGLALDITITTEMEKEFNATAEEVAKRLRAAIQPLASPPPHPHPVL